MFGFLTRLYLYSEGKNRDPFRQWESCVVFGLSTIFPCNFVYLNGSLFLPSLDLYALFQIDYLYLFIMYLYLTRYRFESHTHTHYLSLGLEKSWKSGISSHTNRWWTTASIVQHPLKNYSQMSFSGHFVVDRAQRPEQGTTGIVTLRCI